MWGESLQALDLLYMDGLNYWLFFLTLAFKTCLKMVWPQLVWTNCGNIAWMSIFLVFWQNNDEIIPQLVFH